MIRKVLSVIRTIIAKMQNGSKLHIPICSNLGKMNEIKAKSGTIRVGTHFLSYSNVVLAAVSGGEMHIGNNVFINRNCIFVCRDKILVGSGCVFGPHVCIYDHDHCFTANGFTDGYTTAPVVIEEHCWIGAGCIILKGTHIGEGSVIGAGCVVQGEIPPYSLVVTDRILKIRPINKKENTTENR